MRIWFDMTASAHPVVFRPVIARLRDSGHEVSITARDYAQTLGLLQLYGLEHTVIGGHAGASRARKALALARRTARLYGWARGSFDLAVAHGSNDLALAAALAGIPAVNMFDYEFAIQQHHIGCRLAKRVITPDAIPRSSIVSASIPTGWRWLCARRRTSRYTTESRIPCFRACSPISGTERM